MFTVVTDRRFSHEVTVNEPVDGGFERGTFTAQFRALSAEQSNTFDLKTNDGVVDFLKKVWVGASELQDENGNELPWSDKLRDALLDDYWIRQGVLGTYTDALLKARLGN